MGFFKNWKQKADPAPEAVIQPDPKQQLDATRQNMMKIWDALDAVNVAEIRRSVPEETLSDTDLSAFDRDLKLIKAVIGKQTASQLVLAESEDIDAELLYFAEHLQEELVCGNIDAANTYINAIKYGIAKGHEPIKESDLRHKDTILKTRLDVIKHYKLIADLHSKTASNRQGLERLETKLNDLQAEYNECKSEARERAKLRPDLYEKMVSMTDKKSNMISPELREFSNVFSRVLELKSQINDVKTNISILDTNIQSQVRGIRTAESSMLTMSSVTSEEEREEIERIINQHSEKMKQMQNEIFEFDNLYSKLDATIKSINEDQRLSKKMVNDTVGYMAILEQDQAEENAIRAGMENYRKSLEADIEEGEAALLEADQPLENEQQEHKQLISN